MALKKDNKGQATTEEAAKQTKKKTAQQWIPIVEINGNIVYRKDGYMFGAIRVQPENLNLLSDKEKRRKVESLTEQLNGENEPMQIFCVGRPVDLSNYLEWLQDKAKMEQNFTKKNVLKGFIEQATQMVYSGAAIERRFYVIVSKKRENKAEIELQNKLKELQIKLTQAELTVDICSDDELIDVFSLFASPIQAAFEKNEYSSGNLSTVLEY